MYIIESDIESVPRQQQEAAGRSQGNRRGRRHITHHNRPQAGCCVLRAPAPCRTRDVALRTRPVSLRSTSSKGTPRSCVRCTGTRSAQSGDAARAPSGPSKEHPASCCMAPRIDSPSCVLFPDPKTWIRVLRYVFSKFPAKSHHFVALSQRALDIYSGQWPVVIIEQPQPDLSLVDRQIEDDLLHIFTSRFTVSNMITGSSSSS
jgi:hypothetical protein